MGEFVTVICTHERAKKFNRFNLGIRYIFDQNAYVLGLLISSLGKQ